MLGPATSRPLATPCSQRAPAAPPAYARREPEKTVLHVVVREHLETFLAVFREQHGKRLPRYVEQELRRYLRCGILAHGFLRVVCSTCRCEMLVAFSCKCRATCPSCGVRRASGTAAHLVDEVLPDVPVRQWVLTAPHDVRRVLALHPLALTAGARIFVEEIARWQKQQAKGRGIDGGETGAVTFVQRFNATLQSYVHFHVVALDGVFTREAKGGPAVFHEGRAPSTIDVAAVAGRVEKRMRRWLRRRGLLDERPAEDRSNEAPVLSPMEACMQASLFAGEFAHVREGAPQPDEHEVDEARFRGLTKSPWSAAVGGFDVHAGVTIRAGDRAGLEQLCRYAARAPVALGRLSMLAEGRVAYRLRKPRKNGATHLVMTPVELLAKIASVVPPPRRPLLRLSGVLGPKSSWRASVVPGGAHAARHGHADRGAAMPFGVNDTTGLAHAGDAAATCASAEDKAKPVHAGNAAATGGGGTVGAHAGGDVAMTGGEDKTKPAPGRASARSERGKGVVRPQGVRIDWASLLKRVFLEDVLVCPCGGRRRIVSDVQESRAVVAILTHLGLPAEPPPIARARDPTETTFGFE